ncbi:unnamed protein product [Diatraea saccharalis]|uniref:OCIA domain-containing protein n=1 Tax=Diatraea saccharalis TaxID=40085 RepID=A0A9N9N145_9NEOP|nr:unnamed protein product [Diatraea saccharalis]
MSEKNKLKDVEKKDDCSCYAASRNKKACPPLRNITHPLRYYEFTQDEIRALEECDKESFYRRCLPFSTLLGTATYAAVKNGYLKRNPNFGVVPKVLTAALVGHVLGRVAYSPYCDQRLRKLPANSKLGELMRQYHKQNECPNQQKQKR